MIASAFGFLTRPPTGSASKCARYTNAGIQLDAWRLNTVYTFSTPSSVDPFDSYLIEHGPSLAWTTQGSNFEYGIRLAGRPDFFGGTTRR